MAGNLSAFYNNTEATALDAEIEAKNYSCYMKNDSEKFEYDFLQTNQSMIPVFEILFLVLIIITASAIGTEITWTQVKTHIKNPTSVVIVMVIQFFIKPLVAYILTRSNAVDKDHAVVILIISCCPSEVLSNAFTYFCDGDLSLSIILSATSAVLAIVMLPLNLWVYGHSFDTKNVISPFESQSLYPVYIISFLVLGMLLKWKSPSAAHLLSTIGKYIGQVIMIACVVLQTSVFRHMFFGFPGKVYGVIITLPLLSSFLGYILAHSFRKTVPVKKAIAIDCGLQNVNRVLAIISRSFDSEAQRNTILLPWLYAFITTSSYAAFSVAYQIHKQYLQQRTKKENDFELTCASQATI